MDLARIICAVLRVQLGAARQHRSLWTRVCGEFENMFKIRKSA